MSSLATFATGSSSAALQILLMPIGAKPMGAETLRPKISAAVSRVFVSTSMRGTMRCR